MNETASLVEEKVTSPVGETVPLMEEKTEEPQAEAWVNPLESGEIKRIAEDQFPLGQPRVAKNLDEFEKVVDEYFNQIKEPIFNVNRSKIYPNAACVRLLPETEYVDILIDRKTKMLALKPCDELTSGAYRWSKRKDGKVMSVPRNGKPFVMLLCSVMDWNPNDRYQILGKLTEDDNHEPMISFDLFFYKHFRKAGTTGRDQFVSDWNGSFGPTYAECKRSMRVNTVQGYTVLSAEGDEQDVQSAN